MILNERLFKEFNEEFDRDWFYTYQALKNVGSVQDYSEEFEFEDEAINFAKDHDYEKVVRYYYPIIDNSEETWDFIDYVNYGHPKYNEEIWNRIEELADKKKVKESIDYTDENYLYKPYWYLTRHGMGPGSVPARISIWTWFETPEGTYFASSNVISTQELKEYEIVEKQPNLEDIPEKSRIDIQNFLETPISYADSLIETKLNKKVKKSSVRNIKVEPGYHEWVISVNNIPYYSFGDITEVLDIYTNAEDFANDELENFKELSFQYFNDNEKIDSFTDDAQKIGKLTPEENANVYYGIIDMYNYFKGLTEDIEKTKSGKWVNRGKEGTHGEFKTKKAAREQQKAMFARGFKESIKPTNAEKIYDKLQKDLNKLGYQIGLNRRTGDIQINQRVFKENGKYKSGTITTKEALKDAIDLANEYGLKTSVEVFLHKPILTIHTTELFNPEVTREALNNNLYGEKDLKVVKESLDGIEDIGESEFGTKEYKYKKYTIEYFPIDAYIDGMEPQHIESYIIKSPAVLTNSGYHLPLYCEDEKGNEVNFRSLQQVKDWIDKFDGKFKLQWKHGDELHAVIKDEFLD